MGQTARVLTFGLAGISFLQVLRHLVLMPKRRHVPFHQGGHSVTPTGFGFLWLLKAGGEGVSLSGYMAWHLEKIHFAFTLSKIKNVF